MRSRLKSAMKTINNRDRGRIIGPCLECYETQGGMLVGMVADTHKGRVTVLCSGCRRTVDYYTDFNEEKIWKLEPVEVKGYQLPF